MWPFVWRSKYKAALQRAEMAERRAALAEWEMRLVRGAAERRVKKVQAIARYEQQIMEILFSDLFREAKSKP